MDSKFAALVSCRWFVVGCKYWDTLVKSAALVFFEELNWAGPDEIKTTKISSRLNKGNKDLTGQVGQADIHRCTQILESLAAALEYYGLYVVCWMLGVVCCVLGVGCCRAFGRRPIEDGRPLRYDLVDRVDRVY